MSAAPAAPASGAAAPHAAVVAFGSNLGDRRATLLGAMRDLADADGVELTAISDIIETVALRPQGADPDAPPYLNGVALLRTALDALALLHLLQGIETAHGRVRAERWGDRTLDLDLVDFDHAQRDDPELTLPHPRAAERDFVLRPWLQVDPDAEIPGVGRVDAALARLEAGGGPR